MPMGTYTTTVNSSYKYQINNAIAYCKITFTLYDKNDRFITGGSYYSSHNLPDFPAMEIYVSNPVISVHASVVEGLSEAFRDNFKAILNDLNEVDINSPMELQRDQLQELIDR